MKARVRARPPIQRQAATASSQRRPADLGRIIGLAQRWPSSLDPSTFMRLQAGAGNEAVGRLLGQRRAHLMVLQREAASCEPPVIPPSPAPEQDPKFQVITGKLNQEAAKEKQHPPAKAKVAETQAAAKGPSDEVASQAGAAKVADMAEQKPKGFDKTAFIKAVKDAITASTPKNMEEVDNFDKTGKAAEMKGKIQGHVGESKDASAGDIKGAAQAPPDPSRGKAKEVTPLKQETPGAPPTPVDAGAGMPSPKPAEEVSLGHARCQTDQQLADSNVTEEQVKNANEPEFDKAMAAKKEADAHAETAPDKFREGEQKALGQSQAEAGQTAAGGLDAMHATKTGVVGGVATGKDSAKAKDEAARTAVSADLKRAYEGTKTDVENILKGLDERVAKTFDDGEKQAREAFTSSYKAKKDDYFDKRYGGPGGWTLWLGDKLISPPAEVNRFIDDAKKVYVEKMEGVISLCADVVEAELKAATDRIANGRKEIKEIVTRQPKELKQFAQEAADGFTSKFDDLEQQVDAKSQDVVSDLADKYKTAMQEVDELADKMREENKGLLDKAKDAVGGMVETIKKMKAMLEQMAAKAASVADQIIQAPIKFLGHLVDAVKLGFNQFVGNIGKHLKAGLMGWLLGELGDAGITMPEKFDLKGILNLVLQVLGLTWANIRARAVGVLGEKAVGMIEKGAAIVEKVVGIFNTLKNEGLSGLWHMIQDKIGDLKASVIDQIKDFVITKVITAGVTWVISLLNPASAFVKACKMIYDIIMFFVERGSQIMALINAILDGLGAIVAGNISSAANFVEQALAKAIPVAIGFLASLLGLGGFSDKIKQIMNAIRGPINKAIDWVLKTVVKPVVRLAMRAVSWVGGKIDKTKDWGKKKWDAAKAKAKERFKKTFGKKDDRSPAQKQAALQAGVGEAEGLLGRPDATPDSILPSLRGIQQKHRMTSLRLVIEQKGKDTENVHIEGAVNPKGRSKSALISLLPKRLVTKLKSMGLNQTAIASVVAKSPNVNQVSGELFEQLGYLAGKKMAAELRIHFFAANRIRSVQGKQFTDGILGMHKGKYLHVHTILEAKAGPIAAPKLARDEQLKPTKKDQAERIAVAIDDFKEKNPRYRHMKAIAIYRRFPRQIELRAFGLPISEPGQARRDIERSAAEAGRESSTWLLDDKPVRLVVSPTMTRINGLLPADVSGASDAAAIKADGINYALTNLSITTAELSSITLAIVKAAK